jgi:hypothetical protein
MTHLDEGILLTLRDDAGAAVPADSGDHLAACATCRETLDALRAQETSVALALTALDEEWDLDAARSAVRARLVQESLHVPGVLPISQPRKSWILGAGLSRAAAILLLTAVGAAAAMPGSPVRRWISDVLVRDEAVIAEAPATPEVVPDPTVAAEATAAAAPEDTGVRMSVAGGPLRVVVRDAVPGTEIRVLWVPGSDVAVFGPVGSRFTSAAAEGRIEAVVTAGPLRIEMPRGVVPFSLEVGGETYLRSTLAGLEVLIPATERTDSAVVFRIPGASSR